MKKKKNNKNGKFYSEQMKSISGENKDFGKIASLIVILIIMVALIGGLSLFNGKYVSRDMFQDSETTTTKEVEYDSKTILMSDILSQTNKEYLVMIYNTKDDTSNNMYSSYIKYYSNKDVPLYSVDLSLKFNSTYYQKDGKENTKPTKVSEFVITKPTIVRVKDGKVIEYTSELAEILKKLS